MIDSPNNRHLKDLRKLRTAHGRAKSGPPRRFVAEGEDLVDAAQAAGWPALQRYVAAGSGLDGTEVEAELLAGVSSLGSGTRILAVYEERWVEPAPPRCVYLDGVRDPGNVGTIVRAAHAFGAGSVVLGPGSADPFGPKAVRASMGSVFHVPLARADDPAALPRPLIGLDSRGGTAIAEVAARTGADATIVVGGERTGLSAEVLAACEVIAYIPIAAESLNAAMAATVALYEISRVRPA